MRTQEGVGHMFSILGSGMNSFAIHRQVASLVPELAWRRHGEEGRVCPRGRIIHIRSGHVSSLCAQPFGPIDYVQAPQGARHTLTS